MTKLYRTSGELIAESETMSLKELVEANKHDLKYADLNNANLSGADLKSALLSNVDLSGADLTDACLDYATLTEADLSHAGLSAALLCGVDLSYALLSNVDFIEADLTGADLDGATLNEANLSSSKGVTYADCSWHANGESVRRLLGVVINGEVRLFCGCLAGGVEEFREYIDNGNKRYRTSRTKALEFVLSCLEEGL